MKDVSLTVKLITGFMITSLFLLIIGFIGYSGIDKVFQRMQNISKLATNVDAAMEMKLSVAKEMQLIMEILASESQEALSAVWQKHNEVLKEYKIFGNAILNGANTEEGTIYAAKDQTIRSVVNNVLMRYSNDFLPKLDKLNTLMNQKLSGISANDNELHKLDISADKVGEDLLDRIGTIEEQAKKIINTAKKDADDVASKANFYQIVSVFIGFIISVCLGLFISKSITTPIFKSAQFANTLSNGDFSATLDIDQKDEVGDLAVSLNQVVIQLKNMIQELLSNAKSLSSSSAGLTSLSNELYNRSEESSQKSTDVENVSNEMTLKMGEVSTEMEQSSNNISMIASAAEEMTATINEIAQNAERALTITKNAVTQAKSATELVNELGTAAIEIGSVTETINEISEQTNLLALNATIESARAGEAGKGFAVVANEIKELARQTAGATNQIQKKIEGIQSSTQSSVKEINSISEIISNVNEIVTTIAAAMEQQTAATKEIAVSVTQASQGFSLVSQNVEQTNRFSMNIKETATLVSTSSKENAQSSMTVKNNANDLNKIALQLNELIAKFKI